MGVVRERGKYKEETCVARTAFWADAQWKTGNHNHLRAVKRMTGEDRRSPIRQLLQMPLPFSSLRSFRPFFLLSSGKYGALFLLILSILSTSC